MGGRSRGSFKINNNVGEFKGYLSLANNGGFSSVRAYYPYDLIGISSITLRIKGDGRKYNFRVRTNKNSWVSYSHSFSTESNTWQEITLNIQDFFPTYRGYNVQNVQRLSELLIREIGIMISDKNEGNFALMIDWIMVN
jgi:Complex I intermediate-associated protein 30 (CIA30).